MLDYLTIAELFRSHIYRGSRGVENYCIIKSYSKICRSHTTVLYLLHIYVILCWILCCTRTFLNTKKFCIGWSPRSSTFLAVEKAEAFSMT